jgi:uncharacterized protein
VTSEVVKHTEAGELKIAHGLTIPADAVTRTFGILAVRGAGKSNTGAVMAEEMFKAKLPFVVVDPVGSWWGLRSSGDGTGSGLAIPIFGGKHGDLPLERGAGELVANLIVDKRLSCVVDLSTFDSESDKKAFLLAFARRLYTRNEDPLHLFLEEADDYIPQKPMRDEAQLLRAWENIVRRGRARGLGITLITQRSAALNKMVLTQVETLIVLRTTGPQDQKAIEAWIEYHQQKRDVMESLAHLDDGEAWVWSPQWLKLMERVQIRRRWTYDSAATPANVRAKERRAPATLGDIDLAALQKEFASTIEKAKAEDPRELRKRIGILEREITEAKMTQPARAVERIEVPVFKPEHERRLDGLLEVAGQLRKNQESVLEILRNEPAILQQIVDAIVQLRTAIIPKTAPPPSVSRRVLFGKATGSEPAGTFDSHPRRERIQQNGSTDVATGGLRRMLIALAQRHRGLNAQQLGVRAGLSSKSGTFTTYLARARAARWIDGSRDRLVITKAGFAILGDWNPLPTGRDLLQYWLGQLGNSGAARMLQAVADAYPRALSKHEVAMASGMTGNSGTFTTYLGRLKSLELVEGRGELRASDELFEA